MVGESVKLTKKQLLAGMNAILRIAQVPLQPRTGYWLDRNYKALTPLWKEIDEEMREIVRKYGKVTPDGLQLQVPPMIEKDGQQIPNPDLEKCTEEMDVTNQQEVEVIVHRLSLAGFMGAISLQDMSALSFMIEEQTEGGQLIQMVRPGMQPKG
jgi:hypothetical protein